MANWIETKVTYDKLQENGMSVKKVTETFLFDSLNITEAESRTIEERKPYIAGDFVVSVAKKTKISEVFFNDAVDADKWYMVKYNIVTLDEKPCALGQPPKEKKVTVQCLVQASSLENAVSEFNTAMTGTVVDYELISVSETPILDVYPFHPAYD